MLQKTPPTPAAVRQRKLRANRKAESYVEAEASARRVKAGIWGDGPP